MKNSRTNYSLTDAKEHFKKFDETIDKDLFAWLIKQVENRDYLNRKLDILEDTIEKVEDAAGKVYNSRLDEAIGSKYEKIRELERETTS